MARATSDVGTELAKLLERGMPPELARLELEDKGFATEDVAQALQQRSLGASDERGQLEQRNAKIFALRDVLDRIGYGATTPQFVNVLFWLSQQSNPFVFAIIGVLNGLKTLLSIVFSSIMQEYSRIATVSKNAIAASGIVFGFSFLFMAFGILLANTALFAVAFLLGTIGIVAYGDLYLEFVHDTVRRERLGGFLQRFALWGVLITAVALLLVGYLLDAFPMAGVPWPVTLLGRTYNLKVYGYLLAFEITAIAFIIGGYVTNFIKDQRDAKEYAFGMFLREYYHGAKRRMHIFADKVVLLLAVAGILSGFLQIILVSYSGIAVYQLVTQEYPASPFFVLSVIYALAVFTGLLGPFLTTRIHRAAGLAPSLVFGTLLVAILPLVLVYKRTVLPVAAALCLSVIGSAILGYAHGLLAQKLMDEDTRRSFFHVQSTISFFPYLIGTALMALAVSVWPLRTLFLIVLTGLVIVVMPLYFSLVLVSQRQHPL